MTAAPLDPKAVVVRYVEAVRDGDLAVVRDSFAPDATWDYPGSLPISRVWRGRDSIIDDFLGGMAGRLMPGAPLVIALTNVIADGPQVVAEWTSVGTTATGAPYSNRCLGVFTVEAGRITAIREYADTHHVAEVLFPAAR
nr:nuclear transport factor 2 family protein [Streptomyces sp. NBC_00899]